jgi:hypothetical protein
MCAISRMPSIFPLTSEQLIERIGTEAAIPLIVEAMDSGTQHCKPDGDEM